MYTYVFVYVYLCVCVCVCVQSLCFGLLFYSLGVVVAVLRAEGFPRIMRVIMCGLSLLVRMNPLCAPPLHPVLGASAHLPTCCCANPCVIALFLRSRSRVYIYVCICIFENGCFHNPISMVCVVRECVFVSGGKGVKICNGMVNEISLPLFCESFKGCL